MTPEARARQTIDVLLTAAGWRVCDVAHSNLRAATGVAIREFLLNPGHGFADYLLYVNGKACGVIEAKKEGASLSGVEVQRARYAQRLPNALPAFLALAYSVGEGNNFFKSKIGRWLDNLMCQVPTYSPSRCECRLWRSRRLSLPSLISHSLFRAGLS